MLPPLGLALPACSPSPAQSGYNVTPLPRSEVKELAFLASVPIPLIGDQSVLVQVQSPRVATVKGTGVAKFSFTSRLCSQPTD